MDLELEHGLSHHVVPVMVGVISTLTLGLRKLEVSRIFLIEGWEAAFLTPTPVNPWWDSYKGELTGRSNVLRWHTVLSHIVSIRLNLVPTPHIPIVQPLQPPPSSHALHNADACENSVLLCQSHRRSMLIIIIFDEGACEFSLVISVVLMFTCFGPPDDTGN